jgi:hypothetical protein
MRSKASQEFQDFVSERLKMGFGRGIGARPFRWQPARTMPSSTSSKTKALRPVLSRIAGPTPGTQRSRLPSIPGFPCQGAQQGGQLIPDEARFSVFVWWGGGVSFRRLLVQPTKAQKNLLLLHFAPRAYLGGIVFFVG